MIEKTAINTTQDTPGPSASASGGFFSSAGRIGRVEYFWTQLLTIGSAVLVGNVAVWFGERDHFWAYLLAAPIVFLALYLSVVAAIKRLHDLGRSGWWYLASIIPIVNILVGLYLLFARGIDQSISSPTHTQVARNGKEAESPPVTYAMPVVHPAKKFFAALGIVAGTVLITLLFVSAIGEQKDQQMQSEVGGGKPPLTASMEPGLTTPLGSTQKAADSCVYCSLIIKAEPVTPTPYYVPQREKATNPVQPSTAQSLASAKLPSVGEASAGSPKGEFDGLFSAAVPPDVNKNQPWAECSQELNAQFKQACPVDDAEMCRAQEYRPKISQLSSQQTRYGTSFVLLVSRKSFFQSNSLRTLFTCEISKAGEVISLTEGAR